MSVPAVYLRARHEQEPDHDRNPSFGQPLLDANEEATNNVGDVNVVNLPPMKAFHGKIQVKPSKSDNSSENNTEFEEETFLYQQFQRGHTIEDDTVLILHDNQCLSPTKRTSKALVYFIYTIDLTFGSFLITRGLLELRHVYSSLICSLVLGILLVSGSVAGIFLHSPLRTLCCNDNGVGNRSLTLFNVASALTAFGVYYVVSLTTSSNRVHSSNLMPPFDISRLKEVSYHLISMSFLCNQN
jgi:hypothetical protein